MKFCSACANPVEHTVPPGDNRLRYVCTSCNAIHYENPRVVCGCVPEWEDKILLCRRAIEPRYGLWTLPAGFMENGETTAEAGVRETLEEANARVEPLELFSLIDIPYLDQIYMLYRATLLDLDYSAGSESLEVELFEETQIPWEQLAFPAITKTLAWYFADRKDDAFKLHTGAIRGRAKPR
jgi:ADP-ribose pyrophosphatase YjhB (NUDIX family)